MRKNIYKDEIIKVLKTGHLFSVSDIHNKIDKANFSTIFRNIVALEKENEIKKVILNDKKVLYGLHCHNHGHFICEKCEKVESIEFPKNHKSLKNKKVTDFLFRGLCQNCQN